MFWHVSFQFKKLNICSRSWGSQCIRETPPSVPLSSLTADSSTPPSVMGKWLKSQTGILTELSMTSWHVHRCLSHLLNQRSKTKDLVIDTKTEQQKCQWQHVLSMCSTKVTIFSVWSRCLQHDFHMLKFQIAQSCVLGLDKMFMVFLLSELNHSWHANKKAKSHWRCSDWGDCFPCWFDFFVQFQCLKHDCSSLHCFMLGHWEWQVKISHALWWTASRWTKKQWPAWNSFCSLCLLSIQHIRHQNTKHRCWHPKHGVDKWNNMKMPLDVCFDSLKCSKGNQKVQTVNCHWLF